MAEWNQCYYCGRPLRRSQITFDHVIPQTFGGDKIVTSCAPCNNRKGHETLDWFRESMGVEQFFGELQGWQPW